MTNLNVFFRWRYWIRSLLLLSFVLINDLAICSERMNYTKWMDAKEWILWPDNLANVYRFIATRKYYLLNRLYSTTFFPILSRDFHPSKRQKENRSLVFLSEIFQMRPHRIEWNKLSVQIMSDKSRSNWFWLKHSHWKSWTPISIAFNLSIRQKHFNEWNSWPIHDFIILIRVSIIQRQFHQFEIDGRL